MGQSRVTDLPKVSCIVCTYNGAATIRETLDSLVNQTYEPSRFDIIIVDNNSSDQVPDISREYTQKHHHFQYVLEKNQGLSHARNAGIRAARGEIIAFIDDDARADPNWLKELEAAYTEDSIWAVGGKVLPIWGGDRPNWLTDYYLRWLSLLDHGPVTRDIRWNDRIDRIIGTNCSFRRHVFEKVGCFRSDLGRTLDSLRGGEEIDIQERIRDQGARVIYTPSAIVFHHVPKSRLNKAYFFRRAKGAGETSALRSLQSKGRAAIIREALWNIGCLPFTFLEYGWCIIRKRTNRRFELELWFRWVSGFCRVSFPTTEKES